MSGARGPGPDSKKERVGGEVIQHRRHSEYKSNLTPIEELGKFSQEELDAMNKKLPKRGVNLPRSPSIRPSAMSQQLKDIEDAEKAAAKEAKAAPTSVAKSTKQTAAEFDPLEKERKRLERLGVMNFRQEHPTKPEEPPIKFFSYKTEASKEKTEGKSLKNEDATNKKTEQSRRPSI